MAAPTIPADPGLDVLPMRDEHAADVLEIFADGLAGGNASFEETPPTWEQFTAAKLDEHRFVALDRDRVVGWVAVSPTSARAVYAGVVEDALYVRAGEQGRGVGRALMARLLESTDAAGIWTVCAGIFPENAASLALHERFGFRRVGVRERLGLMPLGPHAGRWRDVVWLERRTDRPGNDPP